MFPGRQLPELDGFLGEAWPLCNAVNNAWPETPSNDGLLLVSNKLKSVPDELVNFVIQNRRSE